jgi:hypothetical protein
VNVYCKITGCGNFICKDYYFIPLLIEVKFQLKGLFMQVKLKGRFAECHICLDWVSKE